jgi:tRNA nucleotidyltransferase (CCA-adding enzyme)
MADDLRADRRRFGGHADNCKAYQAFFRIAGGFLARIPKKLAAARRASALLRRNELRALLRIASGLGQRVWIVGGAARDLVLGRAIPEVDAAVSGDGRELALAMEREGFGRAVPLSPGSPRVFRVAGRREVDLAEIEGGSIEADLARRDFTVNAIAFDVAARDWLDPFGGIDDLAARRLRLVAARNIREDPLRALRAARFVATHGLRPDSETLRVCRRAAPALARVALERIGAEMNKMLEAPRTGPALRWAARARVLAPALRVSSGAERRLARSARVLDAPAVQRMPPPGRRRLRLALLCARLGLGPAGAASWLAARRWSRAESGQVASLLGLVAAAGDANTPLRQWEWVRDAGTLAADALALLRVLLPGRRARLLSRRASSARRRGPRVSGRDVLAWLRIPPGPAVGRLLADLETASLSGEVRTRRQARAWLVGQAWSGRPGVIIPSS